MKLILPILVGAIIGYFTNWLAIKMLFRPHNEKRIFGIVIPFTPGLIPKEKTRMAETIGQTVGTHLLSSETIVNALSSTKINFQIEKWFAEKIDELKQSNKLIKDVLLDILVNNLEKIISTVENNIKNLICDQLRNEKFKIKVVNIIVSEIFNKFNEDTYRQLKEKAQKYIYNISKTSEVKEGIKNIIDIKIKEFECDERQLSEILPNNLSESISVYLDEHSDKVTGFVKDIIKSETVEEKLKTGIKEIVKQNVSSVITMFISPESISDKVFDSIQDYITLEENKSNVSSTIRIIIDKLLSTKMNDIIKALSEDDKEKTLTYLLDVVSSYVTNKQNQERIFDVIEQSIRNNEKNIKDKAQNLIKSGLDDIVESLEFINYISKIVKDIIHDILNKPISAVFQTFDASSASEVTKLIMNVINVFVRTKSSGIIEMLNISKIVEKQINSFDVAFAEKLIIEIANKELKAITWFGAVLGGMIGILTPVLQYFY